MVNQFFLLTVLSLFLSLSTTSCCQIDNKIVKDSTFKLDEFPTGLKDLKFNKLCTNITFPLEAINKGIYEGFVYCSFKINDIGQLYDIKPFKYSNKVFLKNAIEYFNQLQVDVETVQIDVLYQLKLNYKIE